jgi:hypothetical protein
MAVDLPGVGNGLGRKVEINQGNLRRSTWPGG